MAETDRLIKLKAKSNKRPLFFVSIYHFHRHSHHLQDHLHADADSWWWQLSHSVTQLPFRFILFHFISPELLIIYIKQNDMCFSQCFHLHVPPPTETNSIFFIFIFLRFGPTRLFWAQVPTGTVSIIFCCWGLSASEIEYSWWLCG